jgi:hypothetical protein
MSEPNVEYVEHLQSFAIPVGSGGGEAVVLATHNHSEVRRMRTVEADRTVYLSIRQAGHEVAFTMSTQSARKIALQLIDAITVVEFYSGVEE